jgi:hypothetical protein
MMTRHEANAIIARHNADPGSVEYPDYVRAGLTVWHHEQQRRAAENGPVGTIDAMPGAKRRRTHDSAATHVHVHLPLTSDSGGALGSGPELRGAKEGNVGASEAWNETPPILPLEGRSADYVVLDHPSGQGCALFRRTPSKDAGKQRTGDKFTWGLSPRVQQRDAAQHSILRSINQANADAWSRPEAQGKR